MMWLLRYRVAAGSKTKLLRVYREGFAEIRPL